jgi:hypothetical protein
MEWIVANVPFFTNRSDIAIQETIQKIPGDSKQA